MWKADLHPRDEYGRFKLHGAAGHWDGLVGGQGARAHAINVAEYEANQARQGEFVRKRDAGTLTDAEDREWDVLGERATHLMRNVLPKAYHKGAQPLDNGMWRNRHGRVTDAQGRRLPPMLVQGAVRVGDHPDDYGISEDSALARGVWHRPGEYGPGRVPILRNDFGDMIGRFQPGPSPSRRHRQRAGASARGEVKAESRLYGPGENGYMEFTRRGRKLPTTSAEVHGAYQNDPRNPVGRMRTAPGHRKRRQRTTWIQRLNAQMEGR